MHHWLAVLIASPLVLAGCCWNSWGPEPEFYANLESDTVEGRLRDNFSTDDSYSRVLVKAETLGLQQLSYKLARTADGPRIFLGDMHHLADEMPLPTIDRWMSDYPEHWRIERTDRLEFTDKGIWLDCPPSGYSYANDVNRYVFTFGDDHTLEQVRVEGFRPESHAEYFDPIVVDF